MTRMLIISVVLVCVASVVRGMERGNQSNQLVCYAGMPENQNAHECGDDAPVRNNMYGWMPTASSLVLGGKKCVEGGKKAITYGAYAVLPALVSAGTNSTNSTEPGCVVSSGQCLVLTIIGGMLAASAVVAGCGWACLRKQRNEYVQVKQENNPKNNSIVTPSIVTGCEGHSQPIACVSADKKRPCDTTHSVDLFKLAVVTHCDHNFERHSSDYGNDGGNSDNGGDSDS
jgi:hypothetical protein